MKVMKTILLPLLRLHWIRRSLTTVAILTAAFSAQAKSAPPLRLEITNSHPILVSNEKGRAFVKFNISGLEPQNDQARRALNLALVLDRSGSMAGDKMVHAKNAAKHVIDRLQDGDIVSVCAYDDEVTVIASATEVNDATRTQLRKMIDGISIDGNTALFAGVSKGAAEVRKFLNPTRVNRIILLSDGIANVGPSSPRELGQLGMSLGAEGISVTTIGLGEGYNEDLMTQLAYNSDGAHSAILDAKGLANAFDSELDSMFAVVAQKIKLDIELTDGVKFIRALGRDVEVTGNQVRANLNQVGENQEKYILLEVEVPEHLDGQVASCNLSYDSVIDGENRKLSAVVDVERNADQEIAKKAIKQDVYSEAVTQTVVEASQRAVDLRDKGQVVAAQQELLKSAEIAEGYLLENTSVLSDEQKEKLDIVITENRINAPTFTKQEDYDMSRKVMRAQQSKWVTGNAAVIEEKSPSETKPNGSR